MRHSARSVARGDDLCQPGARCRFPRPRGDQGARRLLLRHGPRSAQNGSKPACRSADLVASDHGDALRPRPLGSKTKDIGRRSSATATPLNVYSAKPMRRGTTTTRPCLGRERRWPKGPCRHGQRCNAAKANNTTRWNLSTETHVLLDWGSGLADQGPGAWPRGCVRAGRRQRLIQVGRTIPEYQK